MDRKTNFLKLVGFAVLLVAILCYYGFNTGKEVMENDTMSSAEPTILSIPSNDIQTNTEESGDTDISTDSSENGSVSVVPAKADEYHAEADEG